MRPTSAFIISIFFLAAQFLAGCGPATVDQLTKNSAAKQLTGGEILLAAKGNTLHVKGPKLDTYMYFADTGRAFARDVFNNNDTGRWDVSEQGELCFRMSEWWAARLLCFPVYLAEDKYYLFNGSGVLEFTAALAEGDSQGLYRDVNQSKPKFLLAQSQENEAAQADSPAAAQADNDTSGEAAKDDIKVTVKWMAKDCPGCKLEGANLEGADLVGANLKGAALSGANLKKANLRRANLEGAGLNGADLTLANLPGANLQNSDLRNASLQGANLIRANLTGANTEGANLEGALLEGVEGL